MIPSLPPSQRYLGSGEDGPKKMDKAELERFGELPSGLETLCEDEEGKDLVWGRKQHQKKKPTLKNREKIPFLPKSTPCGHWTPLMMEGMRMPKFFVALGEGWGVVFFLS